MCNEGPRRHADARRICSSSLSGEGAVAIGVALTGLGLSELQSRPHLVDPQTCALDHIQVVAEGDHRSHVQVRSEFASLGPGDPQHPAGAQPVTQSAELLPHLLLSDDEQVQVIELARQRLGKVEGREDPSPRSPLPKRRTDTRVTRA